MMASTYRCGSPWSNELKTELFVVAIFAAAGPLLVSRSVDCFSGLFGYWLSAAWIGFSLRRVRLGVAIPLSVASLLAVFCVTWVLSYSGGRRFLPDPTDDVFFAQQLILFPLLPLSSFCISMLVRHLSTSRIHDSGSQPCPKCKYSLVGNLSGVCPECGRKVESDEDSEFDNRPGSDNPSA